MRLMPCSPKPFSFHTTMRSLFVPLKLSAEARKLRFVTDLDPSIDRAATKTAIEGDMISVGVFVGDEQRLRYVILSSRSIWMSEHTLRQVVTNLASNACKFTPAGGEVRITTSLLAEAPSGHSTDGSEDASRGARAGTITVRIEVTDTGSGIHRKDMIESKLFSSFSQTEQGRLQGEVLVTNLGIYTHPINRWQRNWAGTSYRPTDRTA
jgi:osomolarity two-component system, sensor histidine kinase SLN1